MLIWKNVNLNLMPKMFRKNIEQLAAECMRIYKGCPKTAYAF